MPDLNLMQQITALDIKADRELEDARAMIEEYAESGLDDERLHDVLGELIVHVIAARRYRKEARQKVKHALTPPVSIAQAPNYAGHTSYAF